MASRRVGPAQAYTPHRMKSLLAALSLTACVLAGTKDDQGEGIVVNGGDTVQFRIYCETSGGSPLQHHVFDIADKVGGRPVDRCEKNNPVKSQCTKVEENKGARVSICGPDSDSYAIDCPEVAEMTRALGDHCFSEDRAGGYVYREEVSFSGYDRWPVAWVEVHRNDG